jgi:outer membrane protein TolC
MKLLIVLLVSSSLLGCLKVKAESTADFLGDLELFKSRSVTLHTETERLSAEKITRLSRAFQITPAVSIATGKTETRINPDGAASSKTISDYWRLQADWNLFHGFSDFQSFEAADKSVEAQKYQVKSEELRIELEGAKVIFNRLYLHDVKAAQDELLKLKQETMRIGRDRYNQGKIPLQDVEKMEVDLSQQQNEVRKAEIDLAQNDAAYKAFFVDDLRTNAWPLGENQSLALADGEGSFASKRLRARAASLEHSWKSARLLHLPSLDLSLAYREVPRVNPNTGTWAGTIELSFPLWSRFETAAASARAYTGFIEADGLATTAEREEQLRREFLKKKISLSGDNFREAKINQEKSAKVYRDMLRSFQFGRLTTNDLFIEQDRKIRTELTLTQSRLAFHESLMEACALWGVSARTCLASK